MIRESTEHGTRVVTLARAEKRNALSEVLAKALGEAIRRAGDDEAVRAVVLAAVGDVFAAGGDLAELAELVEADDGASRVLAIGEELEAILACPVPIVAAVAGDVYGGGCELLLQCDLAVMEEGTKLSFRHSRMGLSPAWGGTARLLERVGPTIAARLLFTAEAVEANEAARMGLVTEVAPRGGALERAKAIAREVAHAERSVVAAHKALLRGSLGAMRSSVKALESETFRRLWGERAHRAAMASFTGRTKRSS